MFVSRILICDIIWHFILIYVVQKTSFEFHIQKYSDIFSICNINFWCNLRWNAMNFKTKVEFRIWISWSVTTVKKHYRDFFSFSKHFFFENSIEIVFNFINLFNRKEECRNFTREYLLPMNVKTKYSRVLHSLLTLYAFEH